MTIHQLMANEDTHPFEIDNQETRIGNPMPGNWHTFAGESGSLKAAFDMGAARFRRRP